MLKYCCRSARSFASERTCGNVPGCGRLRNTTPELRGAIALHDKTIGHRRRPRSSLSYGDRHYPSEAHFPPYTHPLRNAAFNARERTAPRPYHYSRDTHRHNCPPDYIRCSHTPPRILYHSQEVRSERTCLLSPATTFGLTPTAACERVSPVGSTVTSAQRSRCSSSPTSTSTRQTSFTSTGIAIRRGRDGDTGQHALEPEEHEPSIRHVRTTRSSDYTHSHIHMVTPNTTNPRGSYARSA